MFAEYDSIKCFALSLVTNGMSVKRMNLIRNPFELFRLLQIKQIRLALFLKLAVKVGERTKSLSSLFISCKMLRGEASVMQKR